MDNETREKQSRKWRAQKAAGSGANVSASGIHNDDSGIFVTCDRGQESKCVREMNDLLPQYIENSRAVSRQDDGVDTTDADDDPSESNDIEGEIQRELEILKHPAAQQAYTFVKLDIPCVCFVKTARSLDPVSLVHRMCVDAMANPTQKQCRFVKRMTPMTLIRKILGGGLEQVCLSVLQPHFHSGGPSKKYAIRPTIRNHHQTNRDEVIKAVASAVGPRHTVDLKDYDLLILVDVYRNVCGMSVVGHDYDELKRYNLAEIYQPTPKTVITGAVEHAGATSITLRGSADAARSSIR